MNQYRFEPPPHLISSTDVVTGFGTLRLNWFEQNVIRVNVGAYEPTDRRPSVRRFMPSDAGGQRLVSHLLSYFQGQEITFSHPLYERLGTEFQLKVWKAISGIPYGQYINYGELAEAAGFPANSARAVAGACGQNPLPVLVPCHRVVASTGMLTGYSGGLPWKKSLLELEGVSIRRGRVEFSKELIG